ncbi:MAG: hypothetical protein V3U53_01730 [bacterium]
MRQMKKVVNFDRLKRIPRWRRPWLTAGCLIAVLAGCAGVKLDDGKFVSWRHSFKISPIKGEPWRRTPDVANILALNDPSTSVLYYDNPYSGGVVSLQVLPRHYPGEGDFRDELRFIYRRMLSTPHNDMRTMRDGKFIPFGRAVRIDRGEGFERAEFQMKGTMGRRPTLKAREAAQRRLEARQPFGGPRTKEQVKEERAFRYAELSPAHTASYQGKVVVFLRRGKLYEFYYFDHALAYEKGVRDFDAFVKSLEFLPPRVFNLG